MDPLILALSECDYVNEPVCAPADVAELFVLPNIFGQVNRTVILMFLAAIIVMVLLFLAFRKPSLQPSKFQVAMESLTGFVRDDISLGIIGPDGLKYYPYLLSIFMFILIGNLFEVTPLVNFPITSRMAIPAFLAIVTWLIFVVVGFARNGFKYFLDIVWPKSVPIAMRWLVGIIEFFSIFFIRPFSLAVRLFANMVAGHVMLSLLLVTGYVFVINIGEIGVKGATGLLWFALGIGIFVFELLVGVLQAYIFTLLSAVYIQTSVHPEH
ncbi:MAG: F0F1 ATP synthase subunit A [Acidimicrobiia bacterium]|nr:F0F1 ATP synthase subunit A [Acidimicrobiia bacterium]MDH3462144.1 F0F1 ATP synthase subunit A [Acidimicrobiia bacterium]